MTSAGGTTLGDALIAHGDALRTATHGA